MSGNLHEDMLAKSTLEAIQRFNDAFNQHDVDAVMAAMTEDCVFENTYPPPDGERYEGQAAVRAFWERFFASSPHATFETEDIFACGDRCVVRWLYRWVEQDGKRGHVRHNELKALFGTARSGLVFVTAFLTRRAMTKYLNDIAWETEVWIAEAPSHIIHFNGERFLGPYE